MQTVAQELVEIIERVTPMLESLASDQSLAARSDPKKWSRKEILGHLIDSACNNQQKFVRMMQQPALDFPGYRQDDWVAVQNWANADWKGMVSLWAAYNRHLAYLISTVSPDRLNNTIRIEGVGPFTLAFVMSDYVEHLKHHLRQMFPDGRVTSAFVNVYHA
jgi:hypothetical protein